MLSSILSWNRFSYLMVLLTLSGHFKSHKRSHDHFEWPCFSIFLRISDESYFFLHNDADTCRWTVELREQCWVAFTYVLLCLSWLSHYPEYQGRVVKKLRGAGGSSMLKRAIHNNRTIWDLYLFKKY